MSYTLFAVAVLAALLKLGSITGAKPFVLRTVPSTPVAKAAEPVATEDPGGEPLDLPETRRQTGTERLLTGLADRSNEEDGDAPVFYRPSLGSVRDAGRGPGEPVCGDLGNFPKSSRAIFPLPNAYFDSYDDTWGAPRPQGGHEGTDLMSPTGTPEYAVTDGTVVPVSGTNKNGWNRLGGYTVMLEAAYDVGPIKKGDLFYYAHMDQESVLPIGTKVRAGEQIGVVGDTGEGSEGTQGKFPPHLHLGWYDTDSASDRTNLESGAMNPYPLLLWLKENGGAVTGGTDATYCEAQQEPATDPPGPRPDLDTGNAHDARPSPVVEGGQHNHDSSPERGDGRESGSGEANGSGHFGGRIGARSEGQNAGPADGAERDDGAGDDRGQTSARDENGSAASEDRVSRPSAEDDSLETGLQEKKGRRDLPDLRPTRSSQPSRASILADVIRKKMKEDRDQKNANKKARDRRDTDMPGEKDEKKQKKQKSPKKDEQEQKKQKSPNPSERREPEAPEPDRPEPVGEGDAPAGDTAERDQYAVPDESAEPENRSSPPDAHATEQDRGGQSVASGPTMRTRSPFSR